MKRLHWKKFLKSLTIWEWMELLALIIIFVIGMISFFRFIFIGGTTTHETPVGSYQCTGGLIKVCDGPQEVMDYLGI